MSDHQRQVLAAIVPRRRDLLLQAQQTLQDEHFTDRTLRAVWQLLGRYYEVAGDILPAGTLADILARQQVDEAQTLLYEQVFAELEELEVADHEFRYSCDALRDDRARHLTGVAITTAFEVLERQVEVDGETLRGHRDARQLLYARLAEVDRLQGAESAPEGDMRLESDRIMRQYADRKSGKHQAGVYSGIEPLDRSTGGFQPGELVLIAAYTSQGKASPLWTPVLTPEGWCPIGDLAVGDVISSVDGGEQKVAGVFDRGVMPTFEVTTRDGGSVITAADHLWDVQDQNDRAGRTAAGHRTLSTSEIAEGLARGRRFYLPLPRPSETEADLPVEPYLMGAILGDGSITDSCVFLWNGVGDEQIVRECTTAPGEWVRTKNPIRWYLRDPDQRLRKTLQDLGMSPSRPETKKMPEAYLWASGEQKLALLQGLMDTDGTVARGGNDAELCLTSETLIRQVQQLVWSIGGSTNSITTRRGSYVKDGIRHECLRTWRLKVRLPKGKCPFRLERKALRWSLRSDRGLARRTITSVREVGAEPVRCISVTAEDHLYVTKDYLVTHNTQMTVQCAWHAATQQGKNVYFGTSETVRDQVWRRLTARHSRLPQFGLRTGLDSDAIKNGTLTDEEERVYQDVLDDLRRNPAYGRIYVGQVPRGATLGFLEARMKRQADLWKMDLALFDYLPLLKADVRRQNKQHELNELLMDSKVLATSFYDGAGIPFVSPWQISQGKYREGVAQGRYYLASLADTSEAEKSADTIVTILRLEETKHRATMQALKLRDGDVPEPFEVDVDYRNSYLGTEASPTDDLGAADDFLSMLS